ncbi:MAG: ATP-binding protein [Phycisphaeraceae bacterium]|nr:ATP-binding protein [Phycisphaeraceae bacterium]
MLSLHIIQGPDQGRHFELPDNEPQQIGRSSESLPLTDTTISRRHAELTPDDGAWYVNDLESANGTYVNGQRITGPTLLQNGDLIRTGSSLFVFGRTTASATAPPVLPSDQIDTSVESVVPSNDDSIIMAVPNPSEAAMEHLTILYELMQLVGSTFDRQELLELVMTLVFNHFRPDRGFVLLRAEDQKVNPVVVRHREENSSEQGDNNNNNSNQIAFSRSIVGHVINHAEGVLSTNAMTDKRFDGGESIVAHGIRSAICVPIKFRDRVFGVIYIDSQLANYTFTEDQLRLMTAIGAQTGLALEHAELHSRDVGQARLAAVGETVASLSHSIRNMIQAIRGGAEVVEMGLRKKQIDLIQNGWDILGRGLDRVYELATNMLAFSKQRNPEFEMVRLQELLTEIAELAKPQAQRADVQLITALDPDTPPIPADPGGVHQAVLNLISNALDAVEPGNGQISLECHFDAESQNAIILVRDNGCGIEEQTLKKLFQPFFSTKGLRGTGLGLAVAEKVIKEHGGGLRVESELGVGTTFRIRLPATSRKDPAETDA